MKPVGNPCRKQVAPPARLSVICRVLLVAGLGGRRAYGKRREHFRFVRSKEFDDGLGTFGAADEELVAYGFDAKSHFLGATQERYSVHSPSSSAMVRSDAIPPASRGRSPAAPLAFRRRSSGADSVPSMLDCRSSVSVGVAQGSLAACKPPAFTSMSLPAASLRDMPALASSVRRVPLPSPVASLLGQPTTVPRPRPPVPAEAWPRVGH